MAIKLLLVFKREIFREGLARLIQDSPNIEIVATCSGKEQAIERANEFMPDVALIDTELKEGDAIELTGCLCKILPKIKIILFALDAETARLLPAIKSGAVGYVTKDITVLDIIKTILLVVDDEVVISAIIAKQLLDSFVSPEKEERDTVKLFEGLTSREKEILTFVANGLINKEIAHTLFISEQTVKVHMRNILSKLHLHSRRQVMIQFREDGSTLQYPCYKAKGIST